MKARVRLLTVMISVVLAACATTPRPPTRPESQESAPSPSPELAQPAAPAPQAAARATANSAPPPAQQPTAESAPPPAPRPAAPPSPGASGSPMQVSGELYRSTLGEVRSLVDTLNAIIGREDYAAWLTYLAPDYVATYSDPETLDRLSQMPLLQKQDIRLATLRDFFLYVVVPSRSDVHVDDISFVDENSVRAITIIDGKRYIIYDLHRENGQWKISVS